jgi:hypothetical protein
MSFVHCLFSAFPLQCVRRIPLTLRRVEGYTGGGCVGGRYGDSDVATLYKSEWLGHLRAQIAHHLLGLTKVNVIETIALI